MDALSYWLPLVWIGLLGVAVALYVVLDGFDLGLGILFPAYKDEADRDLIMNSVAPFWDGNETWLILGGGGLFVAFPMAYGIIMSGLYLPVIIMLLALVFRGVAFEFRWVAKPHHALWDIAFIGGSTVAAFMQGVILGGLIDGITVKNGAFAGDILDWLTPFPIFIGIATVAGYALLGATWLILKTEGEVAVQARAQARVLLPLVLIAMTIVSFGRLSPCRAFGSAGFRFPTSSICRQSRCSLRSRPICAGADWSAVTTQCRSSRPLRCSY